MSLTNEDLLALSKMMDQKLQPINDRLDKIESEVLVLKKETRVIKDKVSDTYNLALEAWGQSTENRTWLEQNQAMG
jgi:hypothetical protein